jgi:hypothetical protein
MIGVPQQIEHGDASGAIQVPEPVCVRIPSQPDVPLDMHIPVHPVGLVLPVVIDPPELDVVIPPLRVPRVNRLVVQAVDVVGIIPDRDLDGPLHAIERPHRDDSPEIRDGSSCSIRLGDCRDVQHSAPELHRRPRIAKLHIPVSQVIERQVRPSGCDRFGPG